MEREEGQGKRSEAERVGIAGGDVDKGKKERKITAKEYLSQLSMICMKINVKLQEAKELHSMTEGRAVAYDADKVQTSPQNAQEKIICRWVDMEEENYKEVEKYLEKKHRIIDQILSLDDKRYVQLLYLRYVPDDKSMKTKRLEEIACIMTKPNGNHYDYDYIRRLHGWALQAFDKKFSNVIQMSH